ncbi:hypothetical protein [Stutzerimonas chloritidismutans]|uniref:hypothetical protein n=1 Tax=Stutzerimonas chloritidismutans TaxID=203192 RepID=UPI0028A59801|nr:hypothetical protein [Stutzerimonas chloritidismutans]
MSIAQRFKQLDTQASQAPGPTVGDNETLDKALALLRRQQADMKALLQVVADQKARLAEQDKALATLRKMYAAELAKKATAATPAAKAEASESPTAKLLNQRYGKAQP